MKQLTMKLPEETHRTLKMIAASTGKTMTDLVIEWVDNAKETFGIKHDPVIKAMLEAPIDTGNPRRWTKAELDQMVKDDEMTPEEHAEIDATLPKRKGKK